MPTSWCVGHTVFLRDSGWMLNIVNLTSKMKVTTWILFMAQLYVNGANQVGTHSSISNSTTQPSQAITTVNGIESTTISSAVNTSNSTATETSSKSESGTGTTMNTTDENPPPTTNTLPRLHTTPSITMSNTSPSQHNETCLPWYNGLEPLIVLSAAGGIVVLSVVGCIFVYCWYRRKLNRLLSERKSENEAEKGTLLNEMNGRKTSAINYTVGKIEKDFSSAGVMSTHSKVDDNEERMSDLYDVTDPDYEDADNELKVMISKKPRKLNDDDEVEDGEYDILNVEDKTTKDKRESDYACAEFKSSKDDVDSDTYDTTDTCNRIACDRNHKHLGENESGESEHAVENPKLSQGEVTDATKIKTTDSRTEPKGQTDDSKNKTVVSEETNEVKVQENTNLNNIEETKSKHSGEKDGKKEIVDENKPAFSGYELVKLVDENEEAVKNDVRISTGDSKKDESLDRSNMEIIEV